jgi:hypothetical protein
MRIEGKTFLGTYVRQVIVSEHHDDQLGFSKQLENCLLDICKTLDVSVPLWMQKNTQEFAHWHQTFFTQDQFVEKVPFDRLQIKWLDDE